MIKCGTCGKEIEKSEIEKHVADEHFTKSTNRISSDSKSMPRREP